MSNTTLLHNLPLSAFWTLRREATLNWLALGLLLAAWNASDNDAAREMYGLCDPRPEALARLIRYCLRSGRKPHRAQPIAAVKESSQYCNPRRL